MENYFDIGKIVNTQGIKGDIRVVPTTDDPTRFGLLDKIEIFINKDRLCLRIERVWYHKKFVIVKLEGIDDMNAAEKLKGGVIRIPDEKALPLGQDEYYMRDLYGMEVFCSEERLGVIVDILHTGANDVYVVRDDGKEMAQPSCKEMAQPSCKEMAQPPRKHEILIPAIKQCILSVNVEERTMQVALMEGLRA